MRAAPKKLYMEPIRMIEPLAALSCGRKAVARRMAPKRWMSTISLNVSISYSFQRISRPAQWMSTSSLSIRAASAATCVSDRTSSGAKSKTAARPALSDRAALAQHAADLARAFDRRRRQQISVLVLDDDIQQPAAVEWVRRETPDFLQQA